MGGRCRLLPYGPRAVLAEFAVVEDVIGAAQHVRSAMVSGVLDVVPAARTVLVVHDGTTDTRFLEDLLTTAPASVAAEGELVEIAVRYDGIDLEEVAALADRSTDDVVALHSGAVYRVAFCGFLPGFAYLTGLPPGLHIPRLATPRHRVDPGSVAIAGEWSGVYPAASPGGWRLLGHTDAVMWDETRPRPSLLEPGMRVRFVPR